MRVPIDPGPAVSRLKQAEAWPGEVLLVTGCFKKHGIQALPESIITWMAWPLSPLDDHRTPLLSSVDSVVLVSTSMMCPRSVHAPSASEPTPCSTPVAQSAVSQITGACCTVFGFSPVSLGSWRRIQVTSIEVGWREFPETARYQDIRQIYPLTHAKIDHLQQPYNLANST